MNTQRRAENGFITKASCVSVASLLLCFTYRNEACLSLEQAEAAGHGIRWAAAGTGKRGGLRVICYWITKHDHVLLLTMYRKSEVSDLTPVEVRALRALVESLEG